jgi:hypothetical protein
LEAGLAFVNNGLVCPSSFLVPIPGPQAASSGSTVCRPCAWKKECHVAFRELPSSSTSSSSLSSPRGFSSPASPHHPMVQGTQRLLPSNSDPGLSRRRRSDWEAWMLCFSLVHLTKAPSSPPNCSGCAISLLGKGSNPAIQVRLIFEKAS